MVRKFFADTLYSIDHAAGSPGVGRFSSSRRLPWHRGHFLLNHDYYLECRPSPRRTIFPFVYHHIATSLADRIAHSAGIFSTSSYLQPPIHALSRPRVPFSINLERTVLHTPSSIRTQILSDLPWTSRTCYRSTGRLQAQPEHPLRPIDNLALTQHDARVRSLQKISVLK